jgi:hypothetical protein
MKEIGTYPSAWDQGEATAQIQVPIVVFASLDEQGDTIQIIATVEWSVVEPTRRLIRGLQEENGDIPPTGTATYDVSVSLDPASVEAAAAAGG